MLHSTQRRDRQLEIRHSEAVLLRKQIGNVAKVYGVTAILLIVIALGTTNLLANVQQSITLPAQAPLPHAPSEANVKPLTTHQIPTEVVDIDAQIDQRMGVLENTRSDAIVKITQTANTETAESELANFFRDDIEDLVREGNKQQERYVVPGGPVEIVVTGDLGGGEGGFEF